MIDLRTVSSRIDAYAAEDFTLTLGGNFQHEAPGLYVARLDMR